MFNVRIEQRNTFAAVLALASLLAAKAAWAQDEAQTPLYVGIAPGCNAGVVSTEQWHMGCETEAIGSTLTEISWSSWRRLFVGITPGVNDGVVTTSATHNNGQTAPIGYTSTNPLGRQLYTGTVVGCNAGVVTTDPEHLNCDTREIGWTLPR